MVSGTGPSAVVEPGSVDQCPHCGATGGVQRIAGTSPEVRAWGCAECGTQWAITLVHTQLCWNRLAAAADLTAARSVLRDVITLADQAPGLTDEQLRHWLAGLAGVAARGSR
jgi:ribosomal protein L37AE/L43A